MDTYWYPAETDTERRISVKWGSAVDVGAVVIKQAEGFEGNITSWSLVNHKTGDVLASGNAAALEEPITFDVVNLTKINFIVNEYTDTPTVAEFETYTQLEDDSSSNSELYEGDNLALNSDALTEASTVGTGSAAHGADGDLDTYWSPAATDTAISLSVKWANLTTVGAIAVHEYESLQGRISSWEVVDENTSTVLASGYSFDELIEFTPVDTCKISLNITGTTDTPAVAEFETYVGLKQ